MVDCVLISKWGFDGSGSQAAHKQRQEDQNFSDTSIMMTCVVPLQLYYKKGEEKCIIWENPRPSSTRFCRPLKVEFKKETTDSIIKEEEYVSSQIKSLIPSIVSVSSESVQIAHTLTLSMIDGKVCNALTNTASAQRCNVCGVLPRGMNNINEVLKRPEDSTALSLGISVLHAYIRFMEWLLHVSYRMEVKVYHKNQMVKEIIEKRKANIQKTFKAECGLLVDVVRDRSGTTNDGNTARRFFSDSAKTSQITGIDETLIDRCDTILRTLSCGYSVHVEAFRAFALDTAKLYVRLYSWYPMPASVHKALIHGSNAIEIALLPIGMLSEEAQEARNKDFRNFREWKSRRTSRKDNMQDVFNNLLITSDPVLSLMRAPVINKQGNLKASVIALLQLPKNINIVNGCDDTDDDDEDI